MSFHIGQEVECIDDHCDLLLHGEARWYGVCKGSNYTIIGFSPHDNLILAGIESAWLPSRFRPIVKRKTDIGMFEAMLTDNKVTA